MQPIREYWEEACRWTSAWEGATLCEKVENLIDEFLQCKCDAAEENLLDTLEWKEFMTHVSDSMYQISQRWRIAEARAPAPGKWVPGKEPAKRTQKEIEMMVPPGWMTDGSTAGLQGGVTQELLLARAVDPLAKMSLEDLIAEWQLRSSIPVQDVPHRTLIRWVYDHQNNPLHAFSVYRKWVLCPGELNSVWEQLQCLLQCYEDAQDVAAAQGELDSPRWLDQCRRVDAEYHRLQQLMAMGKVAEPAAPLTPEELAELFPYNELDNEELVVECQHNVTLGSCDSGGTLTSETVIWAEENLEEDIYSHSQVSVDMMDPNAVTPGGSDTQMQPEHVVVPAEPEYGVSAASENLPIADHSSETVTIIAVLTMEEAEKREAPSGPYSSSSVPGPEQISEAGSWKITLGGVIERVSDPLEDLEDVAGNMLDKQKLAWGQPRETQEDLSLPRTAQLGEWDEAPEVIMETSAVQLHSSVPPVPQLVGLGEESKPENKMENVPGETQLLLCEGAMEGSEAFEGGALGEELQIHPAPLQPTSAIVLITEGDPQPWPTPERFPDVGLLPQNTLFPDVPEAKGVRSPKEEGEEGQTSDDDCCPPWSRVIEPHIWDSGGECKNCELLSPNPPDPGKGPGGLDSNWSPHLFDPGGRGVISVHDNWAE